MEDGIPQEIKVESFRRRPTCATQERHHIQRNDTTPLGDAAHGRGQEVSQLILFIYCCSNFL